MKETTPGMGGCGGVFFLASPGELVIEVEKRDRNQRQQHTELRAILFGPDRQVIQEAVIPDDGHAPGSGAGPTDRAILSANVFRTGVYGMMVMFSNDRYGEDVIWRFRSNCPKYLIETSRGHKDARHEEPIVLLEPERAADVCFLPRAGAFEVEVSDVPKGVESLALFGGDRQMHLKVADGKVVYTVPADAKRGDVPWRLHLPKGQAKIHIDGVTRWDDGDAYPDLSLWSPDEASFFSLHRYRWLITPYTRVMYGRTGEEKAMQFVVHNNGARETTVEVDLEFPGAAWDVNLAQTEVCVGARAQVAVEVRFVVPGKINTVHVRVRPSEHPAFTTYATLKVLPGKAPAALPLSMPLVLKPFAHENEQLGYAPDYPVENQVYFDAKNRPFVRASEGVMTWRDGAWVAAGASQPVASAHAGPWTKVAFDADGDAYVLAMAQGVPTLFHSADEGRTFTPHPLPESSARSFDIEQFSGHNVPEGPPPIVRYTHRQSDPKLFWRKFGDLELLLPKKTDRGIEWEDPIFLSDKGLGLSSHSGIPSSVVSRGSKVHVGWGEATEPEANVPGVPAFVATYDRETGQLSKPVLIGYGAPPNDVHNTPCITMDSQGYLHVLTGTHGSPFHYSRSLKPNDATGGWTEPAPVGEGLRQTYIGLVCGPDDTLHLAFRLWRHHTEYFPASYFAGLSHMSKRPGEPWSEPRVLVVAPFSEYSIYYHRLTLDRKGRLFLSYDYWSTFWYYRTDHPGRRRALLMSPDGGQTWKLAEGRDLVG